MNFRLATFFFVVCASAAASAQATLTTDIKNDYHTIRDYFIRSAEKMPEEKYSFKPSPDVRSFAQQMAHVADDQYNLCMPAMGETRKDEYQHIEKTLSSKTDLVPALKAAFAYCDSAYDSLNDANSVKPSSGKSGRNRASMLNWNLWHTWEHYGNIVVYLRMNGPVPPSSEPKKK